MYPFLLEPYDGPKTRYTCPSCGKAREFSRYIDMRTGEHFADHVGICNRANSCGYHYTPSDYFKEHQNQNQYSSTVQQATKRFLSVKYPVQRPVAIDFIPHEIFEKTISPTHYQQNNLINFLLKHCGYALTIKACKRFHMGTSKYWPGATIFWQIDQEGQVRTGKIMLYNAETGKRVKDSGRSYITWVHSLLKSIQNEKQQNVLTKPFNLNQCLFGLHQQSVAQSSSVIIVESEKTALIASIYLPQYTWMACGGLRNVNAKALHYIKHCSIVLFPDINAHSEWEKKASDLRSMGFRMQVSTLLEMLPNAEHCNGLDIADFLLLQPPPKSPLDRLIDKNPTLQQLVDRLDLIPVNA